MCKHKNYYCVCVIIFIIIDINFPLLVYMYLTRNCIVVKIVVEE